MARINVKPLSANQCWQGRKFKTKDYINYEKYVLSQLVAMKLPEPPFSLEMTVAFSNKLSDIDNFIKPFLDILQKRYGFNDRDVYELRVRKVVVKKGEEYIDFSIKQLQ